ncbi:PACE efflux transporter [Citricoccus sp. NPDC055426]|uniref:PACE efflux transporter n=1 Tax=Citricoccus sp. NPDC055426 TaxID=3155536 RepID=UPI0034482A05
MSTNAPCPPDAQDSAQNSALGHAPEPEVTEATPASTTPATREVPKAPGGRRALVGRRVFRTPLVRRVVYAVVFEAFAILFATLILTLMGNPPGASAAVGVVSSVVALIWNMVFNTLFERWERRSGHTGRPLWVRLMHTVLFEAGLLVFLIPAVALLLQVGLWEAFLYEAALLVFFLIYNAVYAWCFDRVFGLPDSAQ